MIRALCLAALPAALLSLAPPAAAQEQTLADVRAELGQLSGELQALRSELVASGAKGMQAAGGASSLERMDAMEAELSRLTSRTEELQNRIERVVKDGTNRIGDLEFRLCEATPGCDIASVGQATPLGGAAGSGSSGAGSSGAGSSGAGASGGGSSGAAPSASPAPPAKPAGPDLAMNEQGDFDRAKALYDGGDYTGAAAQLGNFALAYPGGPLTGQALYLRGEALRQSGDTGGAARAYLDAFSAGPQGEWAGPSLLNLGTSLADLGQVNEACQTLREVASRFPGSESAAKAQTSMQGYACP